MTSKRLAQSRLELAPDEMRIRSPTRRPKPIISQVGIYVQLPRWQGRRARADQKQNGRSAFAERPDLLVFSRSGELAKRLVDDGDAQGVGAAAEQHDGTLNSRPEKREFPATTLV